MDPSFERLIATAQVAENEGRDADAEAAYLQAVGAAGDDALTVGSLYIDLGRNANAGRRDEDAARFFQTAISTLEGLRGDGMIECAYAHYNLARLMARLERPEAVGHAHRARDLLDRHPFTSPTDLADARILYVVVVAEASGSLTERDMPDAWPRCSRRRPNPSTPRCSKASFPTRVHDDASVSL